MKPLVKWTDIWGRRHTDADHASWCGLVISCVDPQIAGSSVTIASAGRCVYVRARTSGVISKIRIYVNAQWGNISVAAYANTGSGVNAAPGTLLATSGSVACPAVGPADVALPNVIRVNAGDWLALACDNVTATFGGAGNLGGLSNWLAGFIAYQDTSAFPCPTTPVIAGYGGRSLALVGVP